MISRKKKLKTAELPPGMRQWIRPRSKTKKKKKGETHSRNGQCLYLDVQCTGTQTHAHTHTHTQQPSNGSARQERLVCKWLQWYCKQSQWNVLLFLLKPPRPSCSGKNYVFLHTQMPHRSPPYNMKKKSKIMEGCKVHGSNCCLFSPCGHNTTYFRGRKQK